MASSRLIQALMILSIVAIFQPSVLGQNACDSNPCVNGDCQVSANGYQCTCNRNYTGDQCQIDPCTQYLELNEEDRSIHTSRNVFTKCDRLVTTDQWYRFTGGETSAMLAVSYVEHGKCAALSSGWLQGMHPTVHQGIISQKVCFSFIHHQCEWSNTIQIRNCGNFFTYKLPPPPYCTLRYCTDRYSFCQPNPCVNGACNTVKDSYECTCIANYSGKNCDMNYCEPNPCRNSGQCTSKDSGFECSCPNTYYGTTCEQQYCQPSPCVQGTCNPFKNGYNCTCNGDYQGRHCDINYCLPNPCVQGTCSSIVGGFKCGCNSGYTGQRCDAVIPRAIVNPSSNRTVAAGINLTYSCTAATVTANRVAWTKGDGNALPSNANVAANGDITLTNVTGVNTGRYRCHISINDGNATADIHLVVIDPPTTTVSPSLLTLLRGGILQVGCDAGNTTYSSMTWSTTTGSFPPNRHNINGNRLTISKLENIERSLTCSVSNLAANVSATAHLTVQELPVAYLSPNTTSVVYKIDDNVNQILCLASGDPATNSMRWSRADKTALTFVETFANRLTLRRITPAKQATYVCTTTSSIGTSTTLLDVTVASKSNVKRFANGPGLPTSYEAFSTKAPPSQTTSLYHSLYIRIKLDSLNDSLIFFVGNGFEDHTSETINFLSLALFDQRLAFMYSSGPEVTANPGLLGYIITPDPLETNVWYAINATYSDGDGTLQINNGLVYRNTTGNAQVARNITISDWVYIGSLNNMNVSPLPNITTGFSGCVSNLIVDNYTYHLTNDRLEESNVVSCGDACQLNSCQNQATCKVHPQDIHYYYCQCQAGYYDYLCTSSHASLTDPCNSAPCRNGGTCVSTGGSSYTCQCLLPYSGTTNCDSTLSFQANEAVNFNRLGYLRYSINTVNNHQHIQFQFKTTDANTVLYWQGDVNANANQYLYISLNNGVVQLRFNLGSGEAVLSSAATVNDGQKHTVHAFRNGRVGRLVVDGTQATGTSEAAGQSDTLNSSDIYFGGADNIASKTGNRYTAGMAGCIGNIFISNIPLGVSDSVVAVGVSKCSAF